MPVFHIGPQNGGGLLRYPGEVYLLPPDELAGGDPKERPHVLLTQCGGGDDVCSLAFASTSPVEVAFGAANHLVNPAATKYARTGFDVPTYVYPSRLVTVEVGVLGEPTGRLLDDMVPVRDQLRYAVGLGTGSGASRGAAAGSYRGYLVEFTPGFAADAGAACGLVVTEPLYSKQRRYQLVIPLLDAREYQAPAGVVAMGVEAFTDPRQAPFPDGLLFVPLITTAFHPTQIARGLPSCVTDQTMAEVDLALLIRFGL